MPNRNTHPSDCREAGGLFEPRVGALRLAVHEVDPFWKVAIKPADDDSTLVMLAFWSGRSDFYRPAIQVTATHKGYTVIIYDLVNFIATDEWLCTSHEMFEDALMAAQQAARQISGQKKNVTNSPMQLHAAL